MSSVNDTVCSSGTGCPIRIGSGDPLPLGVHEACDGFNLAVFSRHATHMSVLLFDLSDTEPSETIELDPRYNRTGDIWLTPRMARCARAFRPGRRTAIGQRRTLAIGHALWTLGSSNLSHAD